MALRIVGAGLGRTGTLTLKIALEHLGFAPCHHMTEVLIHPEQMAFWRRAGDGEMVDWDEVFSAYLASVDWPGAHFYKQLADHYPDAKVILTVRDPKRWFDSASETIFKVMQSGVMSEGKPPEDPSRFAEIIIEKNTFHGDFSEANAIATFERHNDEVRRLIPPERLLVYEVTQGWQPLCAFLGLPVPDAPFPRTNARDEFWASTRSLTERG